jgi:DNA-binding transcriptional MerR regulator
MMSLADDIGVQGAGDGDPDPGDCVFEGRVDYPRHSSWHSCFMSRSHGGQSKPSSTPEVKGLIAIGELSRRTGVSASALRYYEDLGLLPAPVRVSGQRRYRQSAARLVATIQLYSDAGFTLAEQIARAQAAREAISHGLRCPHEDLEQCPNFTAGVTARLAGRPLSASHPQLHGHEDRPDPPRSAPQRPVSGRCAR